MSLRRYPEYKDSGVDWLGKIPAHWAVSKFRHVFQESPEKIDGQVVGVMLSVSGYRGIEIKEYDDDNRRRSDDDLIGYRIVRPGQLVVNTMWLNYAGLGVSDHEGHVSPAYRSYWIDEMLSKRFIHYMMRCSSFVQGYTKFLTGIRPNSLQMGREDLMSFQVLLPPQEDQEAIATFLDREAAKIDALIAEQEKLLALLAEKRQATISHAVTKGLNHDAPMKDSGVAWLGEVPAHWACQKLTTLTDGIGDGLHGTPTYVDDSEYSFINGNNLVGGSIAITDTTRHVSKEEYLSQSIGLNAQSILLSINGTIGNFALYNGEMVMLGKSAAYIICSSKIDRRYLAYFFRTDSCRNYFFNSLTGTTIHNLSLETIRATRVPLPPKEEQSSICSFLAAETARLDTLTTEATHAIELLKERRSALISAAVTGKIDVRERIVEPEPA